MGDIRLARDQGIVSAYLNVTAVIFALVIAAIAIGVAIGVYGPTFYLQQCIESGMRPILSKFHSASEWRLQTLHINQLLEECMTLCGEPERVHTQLAHCHSNVNHLPQG